MNEAKCNFYEGLISDLAKQIASAEARLPQLKEEERMASANLRSEECRISNLKIKFTHAVKKVGLDKSTLERNE